MSARAASARDQVEAAEGSVAAVERRLAKEAMDRAAQRTAALDDAERYARELRRGYEEQAARSRGVALPTGGGEDEDEDGDDTELLHGDDDGADELKPAALWRRLRRTVREAAREAQVLDFAAELLAKDEPPAPLKVETTVPVGRSWESGFDISGRATPPREHRRERMESQWTPPAEGEDNEC